ncbi:MAG: macro domain-containing protein [Blastocatellia bacterium]|nr:macro domain-containing protein [Blastocatellia bacterium]
MIAEIVRGNLLNQPVEVIVNAWNRNYIPWWLLLPSGVAGAIKRRAGLQPFREVAKFGLLPLGQAVLTSAGKLNYRGIIHVAGINLLWRASEFSIRTSVKNAMQIINDQNFSSVAFPIIGSGSGGFKQAKALEIMLDELNNISSEAKIVVVEFSKK